MISSVFPKHLVRNDDCRSTGWGMALASSIRLCSYQFQSCTQHRRTKLEREVVETVSGPASNSTDFLLVAVVSLFFLTSAAFIVGGVVGYTRASASAVKVIAISTAVFGLELVVTGALGTFEAVGQDTFASLVTAEAALLAAVIWLSTLTDCAIEEPDSGNNKIAWVLIIVLTNVVGAGLYLFVRRPRRIAAAMSAAG